MANVPMWKVYLVGHTSLTAKGQSFLNATSHGAALVDWLGFC